MSFSSPRILRYTYLLYLLGLFQLWQFLCLSLFFMTLTLLKIFDQLFYKMLFNLSFSDVFSELDSMSVFGGRIHRSDVVSSSMHHIRVMLICFLLVMVTLITWLRWCLLSFSTVVTTFPFVTNISRREWYLETMQMSCFSSLTNFGVGVAYL